MLPHTLLDPTSGLALELRYECTQQRVGLEQLLLIEALEGENFVEHMEDSGVGIRESRPTEVRPARGFQRAFELRQRPSQLGAWLLEESGLAAVQQRGHTAQSLSEPSLEDRPHHHRLEQRVEDLVEQRLREQRQLHRARVRLGLGRRGHADALADEAHDFRRLDAMGPVRGGDRGAQVRPEQRRSIAHCRLLVRVEALWVRVDAHVDERGARQVEEDAHLLAPIRGVKIDEAPAARRVRHHHSSVPRYF
mmetsp:Transcript_26578/g.40003  ORF Transcript_26578/g.40003 Transcript_26578/m.40003 type:complete len:250 (-) Transcript_26578:18-767(-)